MSQRASQVYSKALLLVILTLLAFIVAIFYMVIRLNHRQQLEEQKHLAFCGTVSSSVTSSYYDAGKQIFKSHCQACHLLQQNMTGPGLAGVFDRIPSEEWFDYFVTNEEGLINKKDTYTLQINEQSAIEFYHQTNLDSSELYNLKDYINN